MTGAARSRRRGRAKRARLARDLSRPLSGVLALAALAALAAVLFGDLPIRTVDVAGARRVDAGAVRGAAGLDGSSVFRASTREAERRVEAIPGVRRARVIVLLPDRAAVDVEERQPAAIVASGGTRAFVDGDGFLFPVAGSTDGFTALEDETARRAIGDRIDPALVRATAAIGSRGPGYFGRSIERIRLTVAYGLVLDLTGGTELRLGTAEDVDAKLETARQIVLARAGKRLDYVDVRNRENPVFAPLN